MKSNNGNTGGIKERQVQRNTVGNLCLLRATNDNTFVNPKTLLRPHLGFTSFKFSKQGIERKTPQGVLSDSTGHMFQVIEFMPFVLTNNQALFPQSSKPKGETIERKGGREEWSVEVQKNSGAEGGWEWICCKGSWINVSIFRVKRLKSCKDRESEHLSHDKKGRLQQG